MKKPLLILIGIVVGIAISAIFVSALVLPFFYTVAKATGQKPFTTLVGDLHVTNIGDDMYMIKSKSNPKMSVLIGHLSGQNIMSDITVMDDSARKFSFSDRDSDGSWDDISFSTDKATYGYGKLNGYPDMILKDGEAVVKIGDDYYKHKRIGEKHFIDRNGELVEVEYIKHFQFRIKESEPIK